MLSSVVYKAARFSLSLYLTLTLALGLALTLSDPNPSPRPSPDPNPTQEGKDSAARALMLSVDMSNQRAIRFHRKAMGGVLSEPQPVNRAEGPGLASIPSVASPPHTLPQISVLCERRGGRVTALNDYRFSTGQPRRGESGAHKAVSCAGLCAPALRQPPALALTRP